MVLPATEVDIPSADSTPIDGAPSVNPADTSHLPLVDSSQIQQPDSTTPGALASVVDPTPKLLIQVSR